MNYNNLNVLHQHRMYLLDFWSKVGGPELRKKRSLLSKEETLNLLIEAGSVVLFYKSSHNRKHFNRIKDKRIRFKGFTLCFACGGIAEIRHHIIWLSHGGRNVRINILALCKDCHSEIHSWLK